MLRLHSRVLLHAALAGSLALTTLAVAPRADACGGCFHGPPTPSETVTSVTAHRMVVAIHPTESILWDQIRYSGNPADFSWVLPVWGDVSVELASGDFFDTLDARTAPRITAPFLNRSCPTAGGGGCGFAAGLSAPTNRYAGADAAAGGDAGVTILHESVVGPYETVTIRGTDAMSIRDWLTGNNYVIPPSIEPVIQYYVDHGMDFIALRLRPSSGVQAMQPIRVRYHTANMVLPLRMISAGVTDKVGITLWIFGNGRYEPANFGSGEVRYSDIVWDWATNTTNYNNLFDQTITRLGNRAWVTQYAQNSPFNLRPSSPEGIADYNLAVGASGMEGQYVTRIATNLAATFLDADLQLQASATNEPVNNVIQATQSANEPPAPVCGNMVVVPQQELILRRPGRALLGALASVLAILVSRHRRRARDGKR